MTERMYDMNKIKRLLAALLVPVFLLLCACGASETEENVNEATQTVKYSVPAGMSKKTETVYVNLDSTGNAVKTTVSDWIHTDRAQVYVDDISNLKTIENIKDDSRPDQSGNNLRWYMNTTDLYYQGESEKKLPLEFDISYSLDGFPMTGEQLIGKSGKVEITIKMRNTDPHDVNVGGRTVTMYNPMLVVGGVSLAESRFQNITVKNGRATGNGNTQLAVLVGFPGINDSLGLTNLSSSDSEKSYTFDDTFVISADVTDFELGNLMFAAIPIASLDIGLNSITNSMDDVRDNLAKLQTVQKSLQSIDAQQLLTTLSTNSDKTKELSTIVEQASALYDNNKALINVLNKYTTPQNLEAIQLLTEYISKADFDGLEDAINTINTIVGGNQADVQKIQNGLAVLKSMANDLKNPEVQKAIQNMPKTISTLSALQTALDENKEVIDALKLLSQSDVLSSLGSALSGFEGSLAVGELSQFATITGSADEITAKMTKWIELGKKYTIFTKKVDSMNSSVSFIFKVDGLKPDSIKAADAPEPEAEETSGLGGFFKKFF